MTPLTANLLPATLLPAFLALAVQSPAVQDPPVSEEEAPSVLLYPIVETQIELGEGESVDPRALLDEAVKRMGSGFDKMTSLSFARESYHWRGDRLAYYDRHDTRARFEGGVSGRVDVPSELHPDTGRPLDTAFIANGDDRFMMMNRVVLAQEHNEEAAVRALRGELFFVLAPWLLSREGAALKYEATVQMEGWHAANGGYDPDTGYRIAPSDYEKFVRTFHKVVAKNPPEYAIAAGPTTEIWFDAETGDIAYFRLRFRHKDSYGEQPMLIEVVDSIELGDGRVPVSFRSTSRGDASTREEILLSAVLLNPGVEESVLRRP